MNKQRKVLVTITYNEMGIIIDTKAEEVAHPETEKRTPQTEQNVSDSDLISRKATIDAADEIIARDESGNNDVVKAMTAWKEYIKDLPSAQPEKDILSWLLAYRAKLFELHGRYMPHEVIGWVVHDFANAYMAERRKE